jgi:glycosyltransferase involved in cell wall biosynthesis
MTAAHNEEAFLRKTIQSVASQKIPPKKWVIVSDGSTDSTDRIVLESARGLPFLQFIRVNRAPTRTFAAKVRALQNAYAVLKDVDHDFVGNLDADISLEPDYYSRLLEEFRINLQLGIAGGFVYEEKDGIFQNRPSNIVRSIAHAGQLVRRECFEQIGGYWPLPYGGEDWCAETMARMKGWQAWAFPELKIFHHRPTGTAGIWPRNFRKGQMDFSLGSHPMFELHKCMLVIKERHGVVGSFASIAGSIWSYCCGGQRPVTEEFVRFIREDQKRRFWNILRSLSSAKRNQILGRS